MLPTNYAYLYKQDLALNNPQWLISHKTHLNQTNMLTTNLGQWYCVTLLMLFEILCYLCSHGLVGNGAGIMICEEPGVSEAERVVCSSFT